MSRTRDLRAADRIAGVRPILAAELADIEAALSVAQDERAVHRSAQHLLARGGKRLRPMCVVLAAKLGRGFGTSALDLAVAAELVHSATLLHDDVVDLGLARRGAPTARVVYGNAISIFAGDWLLIDALRRVRRSSTADVMERLLDVIDEMIVAESRQLERRGTLQNSFEDWSCVAAGKTAALFRWAMYAGARVGGLTAEESDALGRFGQHVGIAFQAIDDVLDLAGDATMIGKAPFADLREGKASLPIVFALRKRPELAPALAGAAGADIDAVLGAELAAAIASTGAVDESRCFADDEIAKATSILDGFPPSPVRTGLVGIAHAMTTRAF